jgi:hypothetical protein
MNRRASLFTLALLTLGGCLSPQARLQMAEDAEVKKDLSVKTVADVADVRVVGPVQVSAIGLVTGLEGTGGTPQGPYRQMLEQLLQKQRIDHTKEILDSPDNAMVLVTAFIPPGARRGDKIDVEVTLPPGSKVTSLVGGYLQPCALRNHDSTHNLAPEHNGPDRALAGHILARASGPLVVGMNDEAAPSELKRARVWRGCVSLIDLNYMLVLRKDDKSARVANAIAERMNYLFQEDPQRLTAQKKQLVLLKELAQQMNAKFETGPDAGKVARTQGKDLVHVRVPYGYRFSPERYLYVTHLVPLAEEADQQTRYKRRLQKLLSDPAETIMAARRLEALGRDSSQTLKQGLANPHPLVRFASAEALAYLGETVSIDELARLAVQYPPLAGNCVKALASLDDPLCRQRLEEMLADDNPELRTNAFVALRQLAEHDIPDVGHKAPGAEPYREYLHKELGGERLAGTFWMHRVAPRSARLVSFTAEGRAEVVLYGADIRLTAPVRTEVGKEFTLTYDQGAIQCTLGRFSAKSGSRTKLSAPALEDIIRTMADLGADYTDVVDLLRKLDERHCLNAPVRLYTAGPELSVQTLAECGREQRLPSEAESRQPGGPTPGPGH